jgi:predicted protein tyrosine phosphatase
MVTKVLFVCSQNRLRSPTAEHVFGGREDLEVTSAGTNNDAETPLNRELVEWAELIFVMEPAHRNKLTKKFRSSIRGRVICLNIPDDYEYMDPVLVEQLKRKVSPHLR